MTKHQKLERDHAIAQLRDWLKPGDTVYTILRHVSRSGMQREIGVVIPQYQDAQTEIARQHTADTCPGRPCAPGCDHVEYRLREARITFIHPNWSIGKALGYRQGKSDGLILGGCGMDMGFHLVSTLSMALYGRRSCSQCGEFMPYDYPTDVTCGKCDGTIVGGYRCLGKGRCPSSYHRNAGHLDGGRASERFDLTHADGYALKHEWL